MTLTLRIDNFNHLPDGGPIEYTVNQSGFELGRDPAMDWTLPDPNRFVSSCHAEVRYENGGYWLYDVSTNGTFVNGGSMRVKSPYALQHGDKLQIGHYLVVAQVDQVAAAAAPPAAPAMPASPEPSAFGAAPSPAPAPAAPASGGDIWSIGGGAPPASGDFRDRTPGDNLSDFGDQHIDLPSFGAPPPAAPPVSTPPAQEASPFGARPRRNRCRRSRRPPRSAPPPRRQRPSRPRRQPAPSAPPPAKGAVADASGLLAAIADGAGIDPKVFEGPDPGAVAHEIGKALRIMVGELAGLLKARAATKQSLRSGSRTMIGADANNPLKFMPSAEDQLEVMFGAGRQGYMRGAETVQNSFNDIKMHQYAVHAALQPALARLLEDMAPEAVEAKVEGGRFGGKDARAWQLYVERWDAKTHPYDNGMLDVFLAYFSDAYDDVMEQSGQG